MGILDFLQGGGDPGVLNNLPPAVQQYLMQGQNGAASQDPFGTVPQGAQPQQPPLALAGPQPATQQQPDFTDRYAPALSKPPMATQGPPPLVPPQPKSAAPVVASDANEPDSMIPVGKYQMPAFGADEATPQPQGNTDISAASRQPQALPGFLGGPQNVGFGDRLAAGAQNFIAGGKGGGLLGALGGGVAGLASGVRTDPQGMQQQNQKAQYDALIGSGLTPQQAMLSILNPEAGKAIIADKFGRDKFSVVKAGQDGLGKETYRVFNPADGTFKDMPASDGGSSGGGLGDMTKSGAEYLATIPKQQAGIVQGMLDGTIQPPSSFALAKPFWQGMLAAAKNVDPMFDENNWTARHKMSADVGASGNSSMGGILSNGKSSFKHLAEYTASAADLGNASHNFPFGGFIAHEQNRIGNALGGSDTAAKIKAINDNLGHYGQESTKFYSGTGGGVEERMNALKEMNPTTTSSAEMAAYADKEKNLMLDRLREKEAQIRSVMGDAYLQKHPVFTPELQADIAKIEANVAKLRGGGQSAGGKPATVVQNGHTYTLQPDGSYK